MFRPKHALKRQVSCHEQHWEAQGCKTEKKKFFFECITTILCQAFVFTCEVVLL